MPKQFNDLEVDNNPVSSAEAAAHEMYGGLSKEAREQAKGALSSNLKARRIDNVDIGLIIPDPTQPRHTLPSWVILNRTQLTAFSVHTNFRQWQRAVFQDMEISESDTIVRGLLTGELSAEDYTTPERAGFLELIDLAASIRREGLINPISVYSGEHRMIIETGERRWLAYELLLKVFPEEHERWGKIPARTVDKIDRFRQVAENSARKDLTMVARARQYALLMMSAWESKGREFEPYEAFRSDRDYYAQILGLEAPDDMGEKIRSACGVKSRNATSLYRDVLRLDSELWSQADDEGWSISVIKRASLASDSPSNADSPTTENDYLDLSILPKKMSKLTRIYARVGEGGKISPKDLEEALGIIQAQQSALAIMKDALQKAPKKKSKKST